MLLLTGQPGTGKSTLADALLSAGVVDTIIDGDKLRALGNPGYDRTGREKNVDRAHAIARFLESEGKRVCVSLVQPYAFQRDEMKARGAVEVYCARHHGVRSEYHVDDYEVPTEPDLISPEVEDVAALLKRPRALFIGRYQTIHDGHRWLWDQAEGPLAIAVRDTDEDRDAEDIAAQIRSEYPHAEVFVVPNIGSVNYGRGVGYEIIEHEPPEDVKALSGTALRAV